MNRYTLNFWILFLFFSSVSSGQNVDSITNRKIEVMQQITYSQTSKIFKQGKMLYKTSTDKFIFPWEGLNNNNTELSSYLDSISHNAKLTVIFDKFFNATQLKLDSHFPLNIPVDKNSLRIQVIESKINDSLNHNLKLEKYSINGFSNSFKNVLSNGQYVSQKIEIISSNISFDPQINYKNIHGSVLFSGEFVSQYQYVKITKADIGKVFELNNQKFKVVNIIDNKIILAPMNVTELDNLKFVNLTDDNKEIKPLSMVEIMNLNDKSIDMMAASESQSRVNQLVVEQFQKNPNLEYKDFSKSTFQSYVNLINSNGADKDKLFGPIYTIIQTAGPIQNIYLYYPVYGIKKEFQVKL